MTLLELLQLMRRHLKLVVLVPVVCLALAVSYVMVKNQPGDMEAGAGQPATAVVYIQPRVAADEDGNITSSSTIDSTVLAKSVAAYISSDEVEQSVAATVGEKNLDAYTIEITPDEDAPRLVNIAVTSDDGEASAKVANALADAAGDAGSVVAELGSVDLMNEAMAPEVSPATGETSLLAKYGAVAVIGGLLLAVMIVVLMDAMDVRVRNAAEVEELTGLPVIASIPTSSEEGR